MNIVIDKNSDFRHKGGSANPISPGAFRAAQKCLNSLDSHKFSTVETLAQLIDESTGLPELLEALRDIVDNAGSVHECYYCGGVGEHYLNCGIQKAREMLNSRAKI